MDRHRNNCADSLRRTVARDRCWRRRRLSTPLRALSRNVRPREAQKSGSYYTPVEVVDAMVRLTDDALKSHLGKPGLRNPTSASSTPRWVQEHIHCLCSGTSVPLLPSSTARGCAGSGCQHRCTLVRNRTAVRAVFRCRVASVRRAARFRGADACLGTESLRR